MFERYTEKARRTIFFSRYEASHYGSPYIETEHLLLGLLREYRELAKLLPPGSGESIRKQIDDASPKRPKTPTSVDLPLSNECKRILKFSADEADRLTHEYIGCEHLVLGILNETDCFAAVMLRERGLILEQLRAGIVKNSVGAPDSGASHDPRETVILTRGRYHGLKVTRDRVSAIRKSKWHWRKGAYKVTDVVIHRESGEISFDVDLASDAETFELLKGGWKNDLCLICDWEIFESKDEPAHGVAYSNGRDWICTECYEKFLMGPDYFATSYPDIT